VSIGDSAEESVLGTLVVPPGEPEAAGIDLKTCPSQPRRKQRRNGRLWSSHTGGLHGGSSVFTLLHRQASREELVFTTFFTPPRSQFEFASSIGFL